MKILLLLFVGFVLLAPSNCDASSSIIFSEPNSNSVIKLESNGAVNFDLTYTDSNYNFPRRYYADYLFKGDKLIKMNLCSTEKLNNSKEIKLGCYTYGLDEGDDYRIKILAIENGNQEEYFTDYFSIKGSYDTKLNVKVLEEKANIGDRINVEFSSESCDISSIEPWISFVDKDENDKYLITHIMNSDFNSGSVKTYAGVVDYGGEFLKNYHAISKNNFSFLIPSTVGLTINNNDSYGAKLQSTYILFYVSEKGAYTTKQTDQNISYSLGNGNYMVYIKGTGLTTSNEKCVVYGFSNQFTITDTEVKQSSSNYPDINSVKEVVDNLANQANDIEKIPNTTTTNNAASGLSIKEMSIKNTSMYSRLKGKIILKVEDSGKAYYIHPQSKEMFYLGRPNDAFTVMREQGVGITNTDLNKIPIGLDNLSGSDSDGDGLSDLFEDAIGTNKNNVDSDGDGYKDKDELNGGYSPTQANTKLNYNDSFGNKQKGKILLQVESSGEAWYVNPGNGKRYFLGRPSDAFQVMRNLGLGISNNDFDSMK